MDFKKITPVIVESLKEIAGKENVFTDAESLKHYGHDETEDLSFPPRWL
jgi:glycolate oxidase